MTKKCQKISPDSKWENGDVTPDIENLITLATCLEVSLGELVLGKIEEVRI
ncbi:helix-turn-helix domain-containing protein [Streptococcus respiraculi]|uniref:helix-turn-helix domain-containing protein n=1 Tax=Streptococcus respiraculi TaxID=2021971 RepID=UPI000E71FA02|nr:helix-turn-helix transcriptional regulator [Streptococcus respiraculi]